MEISKLVNDAVKEEVRKSLESELKRKKIVPSVLVRKYLEGKEFQEILEKKVRLASREWVSELDFFDDIPDDFYKRIMKKAHKAIFR